MSNPYYNHGTTPATNSSGSSALVRAEFDSITTGFGLLPPLTPGGFVVGNVGGSALAMSSNISESGTTVTAANALTVNGVFLAKGGGLLSGGNWGIYASGAAITASFPLDVVGTVNVRDNRNLGTTVGAKLFGGDAGNNPWVGSNAALPFEIRTNSAAQIGVDANGNVGIGAFPNNTHGYKFEVTADIGMRIGNAALSQAMSIDAGGTTANFATFNLAGSTHGYIWSDGGTERMRIDANGHLGIGVTPAATSTVQVKTAANQDLAIQTSSVVASGVQLNAVNDTAGAQIPMEFGASTWNWQAAGVNKLTLSGAGVLADGGSNTYTPVVRAVKTAATARSSTIALADDPHLVAALGVGTWSYRVWLPVWCTTANTGQFKVAVAYSSTSTTNSMGVTGSTGVNSGFTYNLVPGATGAGAIVPGVGAAPVDFVLLEGVLVATGAGNISVQWAQTVSNGNAVNVGIGGYITCTKIA